MVDERVAAGGAGDPAIATAGGGNPLCAASPHLTRLTSFNFARRRAIGSRWRKLPAQRQALLVLVEHGVRQRGRRRRRLS
jgi:hypothetical protein